MYDSAEVSAAIVAERDVGFICQPAIRNAMRHCVRSYIIVIPEILADGPANAI